MFVAIIEVVLTGIRIPALWITSTFMTGSISHAHEERQKRILMPATIPEAEATLRQTVT
jgi:hypothetical protein